MVLFCTECGSICVIRIIDIINDDNDTTSEASEDSEGSKKYMYVCSFCYDPTKKNNYMKDVADINNGVILELNLSSSVPDFKVTPNLVNDCALERRIINCEKCDKDTEHIYFKYNLMRNDMNIMCTECKTVGDLRDGDLQDVSSQ